MAGLRSHPHTAAEPPGGPGPFGAAAFAARLLYFAMLEIGHRPVGQDSLWRPDDHRGEEPLCTASTPTTPP